MRKITLFGIVLFTCLMGMNLAVKSQDSPFSLGVDVFNRYIWRGVDLGGQSPSIQPTLKYTLNSKDTTHSLVIGAWGAYNYNTANQEADLFLSYTFKGKVSLTLTDYYFPGYPTYTTKQARYFNYKSDSTGHVMEAVVGFNDGSGKIPVTFLFAMNFYGYDSRRINDDGTDGGIFMSKYVELGYKKNVKGVDFNVFCGAAIDDPKEKNGELGFYGNKSNGIINLGIKAAKKIEITDKFSVPVQCSVITNPEAEKIYLVFGVSF